MRAAGLAVGVIAALGLTAPLALASHYQASLEGSNFEIDDDANFVLDHDPVGVWKDWANVDEVRATDLATGQTDNSYQGGTKEDTVCPSTTTGSIPNNKSDLKSFGVYVEAGTSPGDPGYLHLFWTRVSDPSGTTLMDFEFNQSNIGCGTGVNKTRTIGDLLIEYSIDQGGARADITVREWEGTAWGPANPFDPTQATGTINSTPILKANTAGVSPTEDLQARTFGEASIDLDAIFEEDKCTSFGSAMLKSRSSTSFTSQLKDFISPTPINLSNCAKVIIRKQTDPGGATDLFGFTKSFATDPVTDNTFQLADDGVFSNSNVLLGSDYTVVEDVLPTGWDFVNVTCAASTGVSPSITGATVTFSLDSVSDILDCTYNNRARASLTVVKQVTDDPGDPAQQFDFITTGTGLSNFSLTPTATGAAGQDSEAFSTLVPGAYSVAETEPAGWNLDSATCDNGDLPSAITLAAGDDVTCTFVNERERGAIKITKTRKHAADGPGDHPHAGVDFTVNGVTKATDSAGVACFDGLLFGSYTVHESPLAGYAVEDDKSVTVDNEAACSDDPFGGETVSFHNTPLTNVTVSVDSEIDGGTASVIECTDSDANVSNGSTEANGDGSLLVEDLLPTDPTVTLTCTITVDP